MNCPVCGANVPDGAANCPVCGNTMAAATGNMYSIKENVTSQPAGQFSQGANQFAPAQNQAMPNQYGQQPYMTATPKKAHTGLVIGIICIALALVAVAAVLILFVFKGGHNGKYVCDTYSAFGMEVSIDVKGSKFEMVMEYGTSKDTQEGTIAFNGDEVTMTADGETLTGEYDKADETITISESGMEMVFTKE